ncbi:Gfo/Idh/MocA family protein [Paenibacillus guangzhouensis]|uniref:Gfo/Idh/MocA family protein n=1 Tax=Paenibacillus guangzhouensis TaxID=1473112 RepID=UPI001266D775|nr:Gfo/Idh/MocA family oxidoreductase [Paenibacillus guangzhouensis]
MNKVTAILLGAGDRGARAYGPYAINYPHELQIIAVAEPNEERRVNFMQDHGIPESMAFTDWKDVLNKPKMADVMIICTMDRMHYEPTLKALDLGYHVLLEKPMSPEPRECIEMELAAKRNNRLLIIGHVLRYTSYWSSIKRVLDEGRIGQIASIQLNENVEHMHMSHSFVRGNWSNSDVSSPMILQKSCHDMDVLSWLMNQPCMRISSYGSLMHFNEQNAPAGAPLRCLDGCPAESTCPYHAARYYLGEGKGWARKFTLDTSREGILEALQTNDYGRCVYHSDNNVVDHQVASMEFADGATATFSMCGFTHNQTRTVQIMGTKGEIRGDMENNSFTIYDFLTKEQQTIKVNPGTFGHGGGDEGIVRTFLKEVREYDGGEGLTSASASVRSHLMAFAAEESRLNKGKAIEIDAYYRSFIPEGAV